MAVIRVKKTPRSSFNDRRRPSALLLDQIAHLEWAVLPAAKRKSRARAAATKRVAARLKTEAQASARVAQLMALLVEAKEPAAAKPAALKLPPLPRAPKVAGPEGKKVARRARKPTRTRHTAAARQAPVRRTAAKRAATSKRAKRSANADLKAQAPAAQRPAARRRKGATRGPAR